MLQELSATQYQVQLMYQHGSATPDTFSRLPAMNFLPPLRSPDLQHPEAALYAHWLPASGCFLFLPPPGSGTVFLLLHLSPKLCRSTSETPLAASRADVPASPADFFAAAVFCATADALRATSSTISSKRRSASGRTSSSVIAPRKSFSVPGFESSYFRHD